MKAPDKIYVEVCEDGIFAFPKPPFEESVAYIRADLIKQPVIKKSNALFDKCVKKCDPAVMKEVSDNIDRMLGKQPVEGLEEEIRQYCKVYYNFNYPEQIGTGSSIMPHIIEAARHFAEWQKAKMLEWAQEKLQEKHAPQFRDALGQVIDKLNSM